MRAMVFDGVGRPLRAASLAVPRPGPGQLLLRVEACGVCRTDLHVLDGEVQVDDPPRILGHQIVGTVEGDGRRVGVPWLGWTCGECRYCLSGRENLRYHARLHGVESERVDEVLGAVGMDDRADEPVRSLSRGMVQRLAIARAVLHRPALLLLDEPKANLDPAAGELVEPLIGRAAGVTRVLTSHDPRAALAEADLVLALKGGRPAYAGAADQFDDTRIEELYR